MKTAAIYCRVSTEDQGKEGTSLESQRQACLAKARAEGYQVPEELIFIETYSGLSLDRPELPKLRDTSKNDGIAAIMAYTPDRLCRNGEDILTLAKEFKAQGIKLIFVKEQWEDTLNGKLIAFILGWASEFEAAQIRERTMRGKRARALAGKLPANSHAKLYGYSYVPGKGVGEGIRYINEEQAAVVRQMYQWLLEGLSTDAITYRLRELEIPTPSGKGYWIRSTVLQILKNPAYCGKTYAFTRTYGMPKYRLKPDTKRKNTGIIWKPREQWVEIPHATPAIISEEIFNTAQEKLAENRRLATRNKKHEYLLGGHIYCARCGRAFWGTPGIKSRDGKHYEYPFYQCSGRLKKVTPVKCYNKQYNARKLEESVWAEVDKVLTHPESVVYYLEHLQSKNDPSFLRVELDRVACLIENRQKQKDRINKAFQITGDEATFRRDITLVTKEIQDLEREYSNLEVQLTQTSQLDLDIENLRSACELVKHNLKNLSFEEKRFALRALKVRVLVDGDTVSMQGWIPPEVGQAVTIESRWHPLVPH